MSGMLAECIFNRRHVVAGVELRPLSIWHVWLLEFVGSPYIGASPDGTASDLALAIHICSQPAESPESVGVPRLECDPSLVTAIHDGGILETSQAFQAYLLDFLALPKCWEKRDGRAVKSPLCLYLVAVLMRSGRMSHAEAWGMPYGYARHLVLALAEAGGNDITLITREEEKALLAAGYEL